MGIIRLVRAFIKALLAIRAALIAENLALRCQLVVLHRSVNRPELGTAGGYPDLGWRGNSQAGGLRLSSSGPWQLAAARRTPALIPLAARSRVATMGGPERRRAGQDGTCCPGTLRRRVDRRQPEDGRAGDRKRR